MMLAAAGRGDLAASSWRADRRDGRTERNLTALAPAPTRWACLPRWAPVTRYRQVAGLGCVVVDGLLMVADAGHLRRYSSEEARHCPSGPNSAHPNRTSSWVPEPRPQGTAPGAWFLRYPASVRFITSSGEFGRASSIVLNTGLLHDRRPALRLLADEGLQTRRRRGGRIEPAASAFCLMAGSASVSAILRLSLSAIGCGVPFGATRPSQTVTSSSWKGPAPAKPAAHRRRRNGRPSNFASTRNRPSAMSEAAAEGPSSTYCTLLVSKPCVTWALPL